MDVVAIKKVFIDNGVELTKDDVWQTQGAWVLKHKALERLAAALGIWFDDPRELIVEPEHVVIWVKGHVRVGDQVKSIWSYGEASMRERGSNYKVSGRMPAYIFAMAEKRCLDRVTIKLAGLHGAYSEDEADDFKDETKKEFPKEPAQTGTPARAKAPTETVKQPVKLEVVKPAEPDAIPDYNHLTEEQAAICTRVLEIQEIAQVSDYMMSPEIQEILNASTPEDRNFIRQFSARRLKALGWLVAKPGVKNAADA